MAEPRARRRDVGPIIDWRRNAQRRRRRSRVGGGHLHRRDGRLAESFDAIVAGRRARSRCATRRRVRRSALTERVLAEGTDLHGEEVEVSILFLDVRGFTTFAENAAPQEVVAALNALQAVVRVIIGHGGHANKFIGDGLLAVFGAPVPSTMPITRSARWPRTGEIVRVVDDRLGGKLRIGVGVDAALVVWHDRRRWAARLHRHRKFREHRGPRRGRYATDGRRPPRDRSDAARPRPRGRNNFEARPSRTVEGQDGDRAPLRAAALAAIGQCPDGQPRAGLHRRRREGRARTPPAGPRRLLRPLDEPARGPARPRPHGHRHPGDPGEVGGREHREGREGRARGRRVHDLRPHRLRTGWHRRPAPDRPRQRHGQFGIAIGERRGQGLGTEATRLALDYAFHVLQLRNVLLETLEWNIAGLKAYERAGFRRIGVRRGAVISRGRPTDVVIMDAVPEDFGASVLSDTRDDQSGSA